MGAAACARSYPVRTRSQNAPPRAEPTEKHGAVAGFGKAASFAAEPLDEKAWLATAEDCGEPGQKDLCVRVEAERRIDDEEAAAGQASLRDGWSDLKLKAQNALYASFCEVCGKGGTSSRIFDRVPKHEHACRPFAPRSFDRIGGLREFLGRLERRIDQNEPAPLDRRKKRLEPCIAIDLKQLDSGIIANIGAQGSKGARMQPYCLGLFSSKGATMWR
jgi:hypothetical protein